MGWPFNILIKDIYLPKFHKEGEAAIPFFVNSSLARRSFLSEYKNLPPIEKMPEHEKREMKKYVIQMFPDKTTEEKLEACKIIYTLGNIL